MARPFVVFKARLTYPRHLPSQLTTKVELRANAADLIDDVMSSLLEKRPSDQLITVSPFTVVLPPRNQDRVNSKLEFAALSPYPLSVADFALIPSRGGPFGLVTVEFGRKGAFDVGARLGDLGLMPGWWTPVESMSAEHMMFQLTKTTKMALKSTEEERAMLRARSAA
ncbi:hypothetical protein BC629DRAFT_1591538 [Irpex lacteus]|nr:hypothetical protein BC629DRAFT_1591538 [Irpex lacteus]